MSFVASLFAARKVNKDLLIVFLLCASLLGLSRPAFATKKVYSPIVEKGELELETRGGVIFDDDEEEDGEQVYKYAIGYGVTDWWFTELYGETEKEGEEGDGFDFTAVEWENRFQLTEQGQYWVDLGLYFAYETTVESKTADKVEGKILLEKSLEHMTHTANLILEQEVGGGAEEHLEGGIAWSSRYRWKSYFEPGVESHIEFGELDAGNDYRDMEHLVGPVFYGQVGKNVKYDIGYLFGTTDASPDGMLKWILEYEMRF